MPDRQRILICGDGSMAAWATPERAEDYAKAKQRIEAADRLMLAVAYGAILLAAGTQVLAEILRGMK